MSEAQDVQTIVTHSVTDTQLEAEAQFADVESVLSTHELAIRTPRPPDYRGENQALLSLARDLAGSPQNYLRRLCEWAITLCNAHSAGISILEIGGEAPIFRWHAVAGAMAPYEWGSTPRDFAPCGVTIDRDAPQLFTDPGRYYGYIRKIEPPIGELLLIPFHQDAKPVGTLWVVSGRDARKFDGEHVRVLTSLTAFAVASRIVLQAQHASGNAEADVRAMQEQLAQQVRLFDTALSAIVDFTYTFDVKGCFTFANRALLDLLRLRIDQILGKTFLELGYPDALAARLQEQIESVVETGQPVRDETPYTSASGTRYYEYIFVPVFDAEGRIEAVAGSTRDITDRRQDQLDKEALLKALDVERTRLTDIFMQAPAFIAVTRGPEHIFERANPPYNLLVGHRELIGKTIREAFPEIEGQGFFEALDDVYRSGKAYVGKDMRILFQETNGAPPRERVLDFVYQPLIEADGAVSGIFVHGVDLTEHKAAEEEVRSLNARLQRAMTETHHRVKNNLQVISALVEVQMEDGQDTVPATAMARIGQHTRSLAALHDILTQDTKTGGSADSVSVRGVMDKLLPLLRASAVSRTISYEGGDFRVTVGQGASISLLVSELVSNAVKHGRGDIEIGLTVDGTMARLDVCDDGPGFPRNFDWQTAKSTGLSLIDSTGRHDLNGAIQYENRPAGGARVSVSFPIPQIDSH